jgi:hypothetical protein
VRCLAAHTPVAGWILPSALMTRLSSGEAVRATAEGVDELRRQQPVFADLMATVGW